MHHQLASGGLLGVVDIIEQLAALNYIQLCLETAAGRVTAGCFQDFCGHAESRPSQAANRCSAEGLGIEPEAGTAQDCF